MGTTKSEKFPDLNNQLAKWAKAFDHPARIAIIEHLLNCESCICGDIVMELPLSQSTVSQHLKVLKESGLIQGTITGKQVCYCIDKKSWKYMQIKLGKFLSQEPKLGVVCCDDSSCNC